MSSVACNSIDFMFLKITAFDMISNSLTLGGVLEATGIRLCELKELLLNQSQ